jgi:NAD(P)H dehydrogenase (quinone)
MSNRPRILVMGATGQVGGAVVRALLGHRDVEVVAAARVAAKASHFGVPIVHLDLDRIETIAPALHCVDRLFMATGYTVDMLRQSKDVVNAAKRAGVKQIVHLGACGNDDTRVAHYGWHQFIERYIEWSQVGFTHLRPEIFMQNLLGYGGERYVKRGIIRHYVGCARLSWVDCEDVGAVAAACLLEPERHAGQTYRMGYEAKTFHEVAKTLSEVLGQRFTYEPRPATEFLQNVLAAGAEPAYMKCVLDSYTDLSNGVDIGADETFDNFPAITGKQPGTITQFARKHSHSFRY